MTVKFQIEPITLSDESAVRAFLIKAIARPGAEAAMPVGWLAWLARGAAAAGVPEIPVGWKLMAGGEIGGVHLVVPFRVAAEGGEAISIQSAGYYVDPRWHGPASGALFLALMKYKARYHCSVGTANEASAAVWRAFKAEEQAGSGEEWCVMRFSTALVEEALVRRARWLTKVLPGGAEGLRVSLPRRLADFRRGLGAAVTAGGQEAIAACAALAYRGAGAIPTAALLEWKLGSPDARHELLSLQIGGRPCAAFFTAGPRGHRGQTPALGVSAVWGPAWESDPAAVLCAILRAARTQFPFVALSFGPVPECLRPRLRCRALDASRRWVVLCPGQAPVLPGWNGLDAL